MSKIFLILIIIVLVGVGVVTGVIEVKIHADKLSSVPSTIQQVVTNGSILSQGEYYLTTWKRGAELAIANSDDKQFKLHMKYVENDTEKLKKALDEKKSPDTIILRSKLLNESLEKAKETVEDISDEAMNEVRDSWVKILANANQELGRLGGLADEYKKYQEQIEKIAPTPAPSPTPKIELKF
jgi:hypothetical protein